MKIAFKTDTGLVRKENQDNYRGATMGDIVWAVVCDGMGGSTGGATASKLVSDTVEELFGKYFDVNFTGEQVVSFMRSVIDSANDKVYKTSLQNMDLRGMGTTMVLTVIKDDAAYVAHIGDSRLYLRRENTVLQITKDHSKVQEMIDKGILSVEDSYNHESKNLITRAVGITPKVVADYNVVKVEKNDILFLCTDGLSNYITEKGFLKVLQEVDFFDTAHVLVEQALSAGGQDNITVLLVEIDKEMG